MPPKWRAGALKHPQAKCRLGARKHPQAKATTRRLQRAHRGHLHLLEKVKASQRKASQSSQEKPEKPLKAAADALKAAAEPVKAAVKAAEALLESWRAGEMQVREPVIPQPATGLKEDPALPVGRDYLLHLHRRFLERMGPECRLRLGQYVQETLKGKWNAATACSGSDGPLLAWDALSQVLGADMDVMLSVSHSFSAENKKQKQDFIKSAFPHSSLIFEDATHLERGQALDAVSGRVQAVPEDPDSFQAGFPCTDISNLNNSSSSTANKMCLVYSSLSSGSVFHSLRRYVANSNGKNNNNVRLLMLENVTGLVKIPKDPITTEQLGPSNLDVICHLLEEIGYYVQVFHLSPTGFGVPQERHRLYILGVPMSLLDWSASEADHFCIDVMNRFSGSQLQNLEEYLVPEDHHCVRDHYLQLLGQEDQSYGLDRSWGITPPAVKKTARDAANVRWPKQHIKAFEKSGKSWLTSCTTPPDGITQQYLGLKAINHREFDKMHLVNVQYPEAEMRVIEISQSISRKKVTNSSESLGTIFPNGRYYITNRCRLLQGVEAMHLQSLWFEPSVMAAHSNNALKGLAGNAFEVSCCSAVCLTAMLLLASQPRHQTVRPSIQLPPAMVLSDDSDSDDNESGLWALWGKKRRISSM